MSNEPLVKFKDESVKSQCVTLYPWQWQLSFSRWKNCTELQTFTDYKNVFLLLSEQVNSQKGPDLILPASPFYNILAFCDNFVMNIIQNKKQYLQKITDLQKYLIAKNPINIWTVTSEKRTNETILLNSCSKIYSESNLTKGKIWSLKGKVKFLHSFLHAFLYWK